MKLNMNNITGIYKITNPSGKVYIGEAVDIYKRWRAYEILSCASQPPIYNSLLKYKPENHIFEIIEECGIEDLKCRERYWQDFYNVLGENGLNCKLSKIVIDNSTGIFYDCIREASEALGIGISNLSAMLNGRYKNKTNLTFC